MLHIQHELLRGLADALEALSPGAGERAAFESPKVAAHGDYAVTAAMQLAKPLKLNPRQLGEQLREALLVGRNRAWMEQLVPMLKRGDKPLVAVGSLHMVGRDGLVAQLETQGYKVTRLQ